MKHEQGIEIAEWAEGGDANFSIEIDTGSGGKEVFEGSTERELIERLAAAKANATKMIHRLTAENKNLRGIINRLQTSAPLTPVQQSMVEQILGVFERIEQLRQRSNS